jgi:UDP-N-acetyl-D-galactosamine dehydrogenase
MNVMTRLSDAKIAVIGLGYVGLPLAVAFSKRFSVLGFDINSNRVRQLEARVDSTLEVSNSELVAAEALSFSCSEDDLKS